MPSARDTLFLAACVVGTLADPDPKVCAIRKQTVEGLKGICKQANIEVDPDADAETLRAAVYKAMQGEIPGQTEALPWPGPGVPGECDAFNTKGAAKESKPKQPKEEAPVDMAKMPDMIFKKLDMNKDGKLEQWEMKPMIDQVNSQARAKGEAEHDLFKTLDRDADGFVTPEEAKGFFEQMAAGMSPGKKKAAATPAEPSVDSTSAALFSQLDVNKDDKLSVEEFQDILTKYEAEMKAKGEAGGDDFWTSLDANADGYIDRSEASTFFKQMFAGLKQSGKDEV